MVFGPVTVPFCLIFLKSDFKKEWFFTNKKNKTQALAVGLAGIMAVSLYLCSPDEGGQYQEILSEEDIKTKVADDSVEKKPNPVLIVRGAKLAANDKNPADPFNPSHPVEAEMKAQDNDLLKGKTNSEVSGALAGKTQVIQQNNGSKAVEGASSVGKNDKLLKGNTDVLELLGVMVSGDDRIALLNWRGRQFALGTGEMRDGITLISVNEASAVILLEDEEKILNLK